MGVAWACTVFGRVSTKSGPTEQGADRQGHGMKGTRHTRDAVHKGAALR